MKLLGEILEKADLIWSDRKQISDCQGMRLERLTAKGPKETFWGDDNIFYLDCGVGYTSVYICQKSSKLYTYK